MKISQSQYALFLKLLSGERVAASSFNAPIAKELLNEGLISIKTNGSRRSYFTRNPSALRRYLESSFEELRDFDAFADFRDYDNLSRSRQAGVSGNSKIVMVRSCPGFPVNCYQPIECSISGRQTVISPTEGTFMFISDWRSFYIPEDVVIIGVENMENFIHIRNQREFFSDYIAGKFNSVMDARLLFVSRYPQSSDLRAWLQTIPNSYVHFGDFDLAGISIFLNEFHRHLGDRASFLIPCDIEQRISHGSTTRYNNQFDKYKELTSDTPELNRLIAMINRHHRCYDQEGYIYRNKASTGENGE